MAQARRRKVNIPESGSTFVQAEAAAYTILGELRRGGMGAILLARDHELNREVAMKLLLSEEDVGETRRFQLEAKLTGILEHPNIVPIHSMGHDQETQRSFFTMKLINGENLRELLQGIKKNRPGSKEWTLARLLHIFVAVAHAVEFAHSKRIIHRDLKPSNIMVGDFGEVKVMDWGVAKDLNAEKKGRNVSEAVNSDGENKGRPSADDEGTLEGDIVGTINYMPPEQVLGCINEVDERSDIYSLGAILYEIQTLGPPIAGGSLAERLQKVEKNIIKSPQEKAPQRRIPKELEAITMKALSRRARDRYQTVTDLRNDIEYFLENRSVTAYDSSTLEVLKRLIQRNISVSIAIAVSIIVIGLIFMISYFMLLGERETAVQEWLRAEDTLTRYQEEQHQRERAEKESSELNQRFQRESQRAWTLVHSDEFRRGTSAWDIIGDCEWEVVNQELHVFGGEPQIVMLSQELTGDIKIEFDCRFEGQYLNDASCFISSYWDEDPMTMAKSGYYFAYSGFEDKRIALTRGGEDLVSALAEPLQENITYHVVASRIGNHLQMTVNGETVIDVHDKAPLSGSSRNRIGLFGYKSHVYYDNVKIYTLGQSKKVDVLDLADYYMTNGEYKAAKLLYENVLQTAADLKRTQRARRGVQTSAEYARKLSLMAHYSKQIKRAFKGGSPRISLTNIGLEIDASGLEIVDLKRLLGIPVNYIDLSNTSVSDLRPLASMALRYVDVSFTQVADITPLQGMDLFHLNVEKTQVSDISVLRGMQLEFLDVRSTQVQDVSIVAGMPLTVLLAVNSTVEDTSIFKDMPLTELAISGKHIRTVDFLGGKDLVKLYLHNTNVSDLSLLRSQSSLRVLVCMDSPLADIAFIRDLRLNTLDISGTAVTDFSPLADVPMKYLSASYTQFKDMSILRGKNLELLELNYTVVNDISPLRGMSSLYSLHLLGTQVRDLSDLPSMEHVRSLAINPRMLNAGWQSVLRGMPHLKSVMGSLEELKKPMHRQQSSVDAFISRYKSGKYKK